MEEFITVKEAASKWNVSERLTQRYCTEGRITGAVKFGGSWAIPVDADKPMDPRKENKAEVYVAQEKNMTGRVPMPLINTPYILGHCMDAILQMEDLDQRNIAMAEYYYFSGQAEKCAETAEEYLMSTDMVLRMSACLLYVYSNLVSSHSTKTRYAMAIIDEAAAGLNEDTAPEIRATVLGIATAAKVLLHLPLDGDISQTKAYIHLMPPGLRLFALYVQAHQAYLDKKYEASLGIIEASLSFHGIHYPIPMIYLHLAATMDYMNLKQTEQAKKHLMEAWRIAQSDNLIQPLGEHHGLLGGMLEVVLKKDYPEDFKRIIAITYSFSSGWRKIHNADTGNDVADNLTTTEFIVAMLAAKGWSNKEIGAHMGVSANTVKQHISVALQKLGITQRKELVKFMLL